MEKNKKATFLLVLFFCLGLLTIFSYNFKHTLKVSAYALPNSNSKAMILMDVSSGRVLQEKNSDAQLPMASTTKIMTAYSVLKRTQNLDTRVKVDPRSVGIEGTSMYLKKGDEYTIKDLLKGMMLASGNDASTALALHFSASVEEFALIMNADAKELGLKNSSFKNPHGLDENGHYTSAFDLATITKNAMQFDFFNELIIKKSDMVSPLNNPDNKMQLVVNKNKLLGNYAPATGVKIGFTDNAGRCFVASAKKDNLNLISVVLNCPDMFKESKDLLEYGFDNYIQTELLTAYKIHRTVSVASGRDKDAKVYTKKEFSYPLTLDESYDIEFELDVPSSIKAPIDKEQVVGEYKIILRGEVLFVAPVYSLDKVKSIELSETLKEIAENW